MKCKCMRDETIFEATPQEYPTGELFVECPTCRRRYFDRGATWESDRPLVLLTGCKAWDAEGVLPFGWAGHTDPAKQVYLIIIGKGAAALYGRNYTWLRNVNPVRARDMKKEIPFVQNEESYKCGAMRGRAYWFDMGEKKKQE